MTKNIDSDGLSSIFHNYDLFYIDLWGVVHNGIKLYEGAISALKELKKNNKVIGENTDVFGFSESIRQTNFNPKNKKALILGAGGVSPSIILA